MTTSEKDKLPELVTRKPSGDRSRTSFETSLEVCEGVLLPKEPAIVGAVRFLTQDSLMGWGLEALGLRAWDLGMFGRGGSGGGSKWASFDKRLRVLVTKVHVEPSLGVSCDNGAGGSSGDMEGVSMVAEGGIGCGSWGRGVFSGIV